MAVLSPQRKKPRRSPNETKRAGTIIDVTNSHVSYSFWRADGCLRTNTTPKINTAELSHPLNSRLMPKVAAANIQRTLQGSEFRHRFAGRPPHIRCGSFAVDLACVGDGWSLKAPASPGLFSKGFRWNCQRQLHAQRRQSARGARQRGPNPHSALPRVMQGHQGAASVGGLFVWRYQMRAASVQNLSVPVGFTQG